MKIFSYVISQRQFNKLSLPLSQHVLEGKVLENIGDIVLFYLNFGTIFKENQDRQFVDPISLYLTLKMMMIHVWRKRLKY